MAAKKHARKKVLGSSARAPRKTSGHGGPESPFPVTHDDYRAGRHGHPDVMSKDQLDLIVGPAAVDTDPLFDTDDDD